MVLDGTDYSWHLVITIVFTDSIDRMRTSQMDAMASLHSL